MKRAVKILIVILFLLSLTAAFWAGGYLKEQAYQDSRNQRCAKLILFAIDKAENHDLSDNGVREALISNLYAAHEFCDDPAIGAQLNDLWNTLIYRADTYLSRQNELVVELQDILATVHAQ